MDRNGAARIAFGQYKAWAVGTHHATQPSAHAALVQVADVTVYRDLNKDFQREEIDPSQVSTASTSTGAVTYQTMILEIQVLAASLGARRQAPGVHVVGKKDPRYIVNNSYRFITTIMPVSALECVVMQLPEAWIQAALRITGHFEDSADPLGGVSGDFDGMGISLGVLQWNIGSGSLQPLVKKAGRVAVLDAMPVFGTDLWTACNGSIPQGLQIVRAWQHGQELQPKIKTELKSFAHSEAFVAQQVNAARKVAEASWLAAVAWNTSANRGDPTVQELRFFDVMTQNGGLKGISSSDAENFITAPDQIGLTIWSAIDWAGVRIPTMVSGIREKMRSSGAMPFLRISCYFLSRAI